MSSTLAPASLLDSRGITRQLGAYVVAAQFDRANTQAAFALGDGTVRLINLAAPANWTQIQAHDGAILSLSADARATGFITGGDDGLFQRITQQNEIKTIAEFGSKWVEQTLSFTEKNGGFLACGAGKFVHLFDATGNKLKSLEHPSTVTGIAIDAKGKRLAASHYNGASLWLIASSATTPRKLEWKGSHTGIILHPSAEAIVTAMQENALHGWRLPDAHDMRMSGYPSKTDSLSFTKSAKYLASSGADAIVLWPFFGGGPMGKAPLELAQQENTICTRVACHPVDEVVAAGYADGSVLMAELSTRRILPISPPTASPITTLTWSPNGAHLAFGTESGFAALIDFSKPKAA